MDAKTAEKWWNNRTKPVLPQRGRPPKNFSPPSTYTPGIKESIHTIRSADREVFASTFIITSKEYEQALEDQAAAGERVFFQTDKAQAGPKGQSDPEAIHRMDDADVQVKLIPPRCTKFV